MLIYAHRGASGSLPENTLLAFRRALEVGADGIELDLRATADGVPVVIHDRSVARTTDGAGFVDELPLARLQALDAGQGERVPTLAGTLALIGGAMRLDLEIKQAGIAAESLRVLADFPQARWAISSFDWDILRDARRLDASAQVWPLAEDVDEALFAVASELVAPAISLAIEAYTPESARRLREAGLEVVLWTVNDPAEAARVRDLGAYAICTDCPERFRPEESGR
jgi:glycerophosphoryl diester phosphodiesterase